MRCCLLTVWMADRPLSAYIARSMPLTAAPRPTITGQSTSSGNRKISSCDSRSATTTSCSAARGPRSTRCRRHDGQTATPSGDTRGQASSWPCHWAACRQEVFGHRHRVCRILRCAWLCASSLAEWRSTLTSRACETSCALRVLIPSGVSRTTPSTVSQAWNRCGDWSIQRCAAR